MTTTQKNRLLSITTPLGEDFLLINRLTAREEISSLFAFEVELVHAEEQPGYEATAVDEKAILGQGVTIEINQRDRTKRSLSGMVNHFSYGHRDTRFSYYYATIVPHVWLLTQINQSRVFQHKSVPDILREVFEGFEVSYEIQGDFKPRNYCVQYRETDWDFASRLMEEEGIYYFFEHSGGKHRLILGNTPQSHPDCPSKSEISFALKVTEKEDFITSIRKWQNDYRLQSGKVSLRDYHFQVPTNKLEAVQPSLFRVAGNDNLEIYDFPAGYARKYDDIDRGGGERADVQNVFEDKQKRVEIAMQSLDAQYRVISGNSDCCSMTAGFRFKFFNHPRADQNGQYIITKVTHEAEQNPTYVSDDEIEQPYTNSFSCIAYGKGSPPYRPPCKTQRPTIQGSQTAVVVGPAGEEIFTDKFGRVKVQFQWDRESTFNPDSSCWVRVAHDIAGKKWGEMHIPRIGQEVIVDFIEGDPDQPIITGSVYNNLTMPHYELPKYKTLTYLKTRTTPDDGKGFNELRFEDKQGKEQVFVHSQRRMDVRVRQSLYETCGGNRQEVIGMRTDNQPGGNLAISVGGNHDFHVKCDEFVGIDGKLNEGVKGDVVENYQSNLQTLVKLKAEVNAKEITLEALQKITLRVGASFVVLDLSGVTIHGPMVKINSGGTASPTSPAIIDEPLDAETADTGEPGYLERPRSGGGRTGRRRTTLNGQHASIITDQAFALTRARGTADDMDRALVAAELSRLPPHVLQRMQDNGTTVAVCRNSVTEVRTDLRGVQPRGWPPGQTWDSVPGLYDPNTREVIIATRGHGTPEGARVPPTGDGHGSSNLVLHEGMHGVDHTGSPNDLSTSPNFNNARNSDLGTLSPYESQPGSAGNEETWAESAARYYGGDNSDAADHPNLHNYWAGDPLNPNNPRP